MASLSSYQNVGAYGVLEANRHEVIDLMLTTVLSRVAAAKGSIERGEIGAKNEQIGKALGVVEGLQMSLDLERGGQIAENLTRLYDYIGHALVRANLDNDTSALDEVSGLIREIRSGWDAIPTELRG